MSFIGLDIASLLQRRCYAKSEKDVAGIWIRPLGLLEYPERGILFTRKFPQAVTLVRQGHQLPREHSEIGQSWGGVMSWTFIGSRSFTKDGGGGGYTRCFSICDELCYAFMGVCAAIGNPNSSSCTSFLSSLVAVGSASDALGKSTLVALSSCK